MKTLKKVLSVVLALAMVLGMTAFASAAYTDKADITDKEAVEVMTAIGVFEGSNGAFSPKANLTRAQAAKLVCYLTLGKDVAEALPVIGVFSDVDDSHWAAKYVAYLYNEKIVAGVGAGKFDPNGTVTGYEFGKMLLGCLGYDAAKENLVGSTWAVNAAKLMKSTKIVSNKTAKVAALALNREQAARYCVNALQASKVAYGYAGGYVALSESLKTATSTDLLVDYVLGGGHLLNINLGNNDEKVASKTGVALMTELYDGDLYLDPTAIADAFGRPANKWMYKKLADKNANKVIGTYTKDDAFLTFTAGVTEDELFNAIVAAGGTYNEVEAAKQTKDYVKINVTYIDGENVASEDDLKIYKGSKAKVEDFGNGTIVEIYKNTYDKNNNGLYDAIVINEYFGEVTGVKKSADKTGAERYITITGKGLNTVSGSFKTNDFEKNDMVVYNVAYKADGTSPSIKNVKAVTTVSGKITANNSTKSTVVIGGTTYGMMKNCELLAPTSTEETVYLDSYGYALSTKAATTVDKAAAVTASYYALNEKNQMVPKADVILSDGTTATWEVTNAVGVHQYLVGDVFSYSKDTKGVYTLYTDPTTNIAGETDPKTYVYDLGTNTSLAKNAKKVSTYYFAQDLKTIMLKSDADNVATVYEGVKAFTGKQAYVATEKIDGVEYAKAIFVLGDVDNSVLAADSLVFVYDNVGAAKITVDGVEKTYATYDAYIDGEKVDNFVGTAGEDGPKFFKNAIEDKTETYVLTSQYTEAAANVDVCVVVDADLAAVKEGGILVLTAAASGYTKDNVDFGGLTDDIIVDVNDSTDIDTVEELKAELAAEALPLGSAGRSTKDLRASFIFDGNDNTLLWVYIYFAE